MRAGERIVQRILRRARRSVWALVASLALTTGTWAEALPPEVAAKIDGVFARWNKDTTPGAIVAIARHGETVYERAFGMANLEHGIPLSPELRSETGSVAKQFTAAAVTLLAVRGRLSLDDSLHQHLPELPGFTRDVTLRMLLDHTSGLRDIHGLFDLIGRPTYTNPHENAEVLEVMTRQRELNFPAGTEYVYSNTGYLLLTFVIERAARQPFAKFCNEQVFAPHGMTHTAWRTQFNQVVPGRASAYALEPGGTFRVDLPYSNIHGNGGLLTTVGDLLRWNEALAHPLGEWAEVVRLMQTPSKLKNGQAIENGLGLRVGKYREIEEISHSGATAGYSTYLARFPAQELSIAVLGNVAGLDAGALTYRMVDVLLAPELAPNPRPVAITLTPGELAAHAGLYRSPEHDLLVRVAVRESMLTLNGVPIVPIAPHTFVSLANGARLEFDLVREGRPRRLSFMSNRIQRSYVAVNPAVPVGAKLAEYAGDYFCPELDCTIPVTVQDGALAARLRPTPAVRLEPTFTDGFWFSNRAWHLTFTRDSAGQVTGLEATNALGRCRRVKFIRR